MSIGYACLTMGVLNTDQKNCLLKNATTDKLSELIKHNLTSLENIIEYNIKNKIKLFRISSDIIPFGSSMANTLSWWEEFAPHFKRIGEKIKSNGIRVSMHPGQYTVLNSPSEEVVERAIADLNYHARVLDSLDMDASSKIILHIGGVYNDKKLATERFISNYRLLEDNVKQRLVIENDDKSYTIEEVLNIGNKLKIPVIYDNLHNAINSPELIETDSYWIRECNKTWQEKDGKQKIHYSQQDPLKKAGSHSKTIRIIEFLQFYTNLEDKDIDIMLEVKDKNLSAIKCINSISSSKKIKRLEEEWSRYKYTVLEYAPVNYTEIRHLLKNKSDYPVVAFYNLIEGALEKEPIPGDLLNSALHVWGYFKKIVTKQEKDSFLKNIEKYKQGKVKIKTIKNFLWKLTLKYEQDYLLNSFYFFL
ncbi:UV-damage endonuclease [Desulfonispora thiosulfatigenes DSM 11270]|uniref:UV-damage endonuclease n=1 Tax=Desulfonispora thiosulfatigenes DSM 11270 TaxID=656914 RepID=A0A1W1UE86_DESTI|nr:UV DNA damage repair endonuclease UvsE [Desulfonispora thiosulfatigenes]SMB79352.1 UV-damage endonuclease [Desulfonispora thiosulfatigenes DSM 11270]